MGSTPIELIKRLIALDEQDQAETPEAHRELVHIINCRKELLLTETQRIVLTNVRNIGGWFVLSDISCQERVIRALVDTGLIEQRRPSGGLYEYKAR